MDSKILYTTQFGSRLFGTSTPQSDLDIKHIELPSLGHLLMGRGVSNRVATTNGEGKNGPEDVDVEHVPLQRFARDFYEGQTYALEIAFSIDGRHAGQTHYGPDGQPGPMDPSSMFCQFVEELKARFLTSNIRAMMGYVVTQASLYSLKGERLNAANAVKAALESVDPDITVEQAMAIPQFAEQIQSAIQEHPKYVQITRYDRGAHGMAPCLSLLQKIIPYSVSARAALGTAQSSIKRFGQRANAASADNVDWKATMHALRIVSEGVDLMRDGRIVLPHPPARAARLLAVRRGEIPLPEVSQEIETKLEALKTLETQAQRPPISDELTAEFDQWLQGWMMRFYGVAEPSPSPRGRRAP